MNSSAGLLRALVQVRGETSVFLGLEVEDVLITWSTDKVGMAMFLGVDRVGGAREFLEWRRVDSADVSLRTRLFGAGRFSPGRMDGDVPCYLGIESMRKSGTIGKGVLCCEEKPVLVVANTVIGMKGDRAWLFTKGVRLI
jgi:hypothetical protein